MRKPSLSAILTGALAVLFLYALYRCSMYLAATRIYQVDECQYVFISRILALGQAKDYFTRISLYLAPLVWLARYVDHSVDLFASARCLALLIFWLNLLLITLATGERLISRRGLIALAGAATLAPLWDYGFEVRQDNLLLCELLLTWCAVRVGRSGLHSYVIAGVLAVVMQFTAFKAFCFAVPLNLALLLFPPFGAKVPRWKLVLAWTGGALSAFVIIRLAYGALGIWETYLSAFQWASNTATTVPRFAPWRALDRLLVETPLLLALVAAALSAVFAEVWSRGKSALTWEKNLPEALLFMLALAVLLVNPTPFLYNLLNLVPFAFLLAFRYAGTISSPLWERRTLRPLLVAVLVFAHAAPFLIATRRHFNWTNYRQERLMRLAENLTDPATDCVYDGIGLVPTRRSVHFNWFLHSFNISQFTNGSVPGVSEMLTANPSAVFIPSYRTDWLPEADQDFIRARYVPLADDFRVLGKILPAGGGEFEIFHSGRYRLATLEGSDLDGTYPEGLQKYFTPEVDGQLSGELDGAPLSDQVVELETGTHRIQCDTNTQPTVVWVGPRLDRVGRIGASSHKRLFVNWY